MQSSENGRLRETQSVFVSAEELSNDNRAKYADNPTGRRITKTMIARLMSNGYAKCIIGKYTEKGSRHD